MNDGTVSEWLATDGGQIDSGQPLYSLESEKSVQEIEAPASGTLKIFKPPVRFTKSAPSSAKSYDVGCILCEHG